MQKTQGDRCCKLLQTAWRAAGRSNRAALCCRRRILAAIDAPPGSALTQSNSQSLQLLPDMSVMIRQFGTGADKAQARCPFVLKPMPHAEL